LVRFASALDEPAASTIALKFRLFRVYGGGLRSLSIVYGRDTHIRMPKLHGERAMHNIQPENARWDRGSDVGASGDGRAPYPTPAEVYFDIGLILAAALSLALAGNLLAIAASG